MGGLIQRVDVGGFYLNIKEIYKFDISNPSPLSKQIEVLLSGLSHI